MRDISRQRDQVLGIVSHDLRTPLTALLLAARQLHMKLQAGGSSPSRTRALRWEALELHRPLAEGKSLSGPGISPSRFPSCSTRSGRPGPAAAAVRGSA